MRLVILGRYGQLAQALQARCADAVFLGSAELDLRDRDAIGPALTALKPDAVINAAAYNAVDAAECDEAAAFALNCAAPAAIASVCADIGAALVQVSSDYVFDGLKGAPYAEDDGRGPLNVYGRSKMAGEDAVLAAGARAAIVRTAWLFSPTGNNFVRAILARARAGEVRVVEDQRGCPTSADDLAEACVALAGALRDGDGADVWHFAGADGATRAEFAAGILKAANASARVTPITSAEAGAAARRPADSRLNSEKIARILGVRARPWREALARCDLG